MSLFRSSRRLTLAALLLLLTAATARSAWAGPSAWVGADPSAQAWVRPHRLSLALSFSLGYGALGDVHDLWAGAAAATKKAFGIPITADQSSLTLGGALALRYLGPYHLFAELGVGLLHNGQSMTTPNISETVGEIFVLEVPLLIGGYYTLGRRWLVHGGAGPAFFVHNTMVNDGTSDAVTDFAVGLHVAAGAEVFLLPSFSVGLEARFRLAKLGRMHVVDTDVPIRIDRDDPNTYDLDMSGFSVYLTARIFIF